MGRFDRLPPERRKKIADLYKSGVTTEALMERFSICSATIGHILKEFSVPERHVKGLLSYGPWSGELK